MLRAMSRVALATLFAASFGLLAAPTYAQEKAAPKDAHPSYLHALSDLRFARAHIEHPDTGKREAEEKAAIAEIDAAIAEINKASIDDGKKLSDHPAIDTKLEWSGRLHKAIELLYKSHDDIAKVEDDPKAVGLRDRAISHITSARIHVEKAIKAPAT